jgi:hypothetical protein
MGMERYLSINRMHLFLERWLQFAKFCAINVLKNRVKLLAQNYA